MPIVSIGLPVYNGENYISEAIKSFIKQSFKNIELIIFDNASEDRTEEICQKWAKRDPRIIYHRNPRNLGAGPNFNLTFKLAKGKYFKWAAHDDICHPLYLEKCVETLEKNPDVVLCHSKIVWIDHNGEKIKNWNKYLEESQSINLVNRFKSLINLNHYCFDIFGLIRSEILAKTPLIASYIGSDRSLLVELALYGRFHRLDDYYFFSRDHAKRSVRAIKLYKRNQWWDSVIVKKINFPLWRLLKEYIYSLQRAKVKMNKKIYCWLFLLIWIRYQWRRLLNEYFFVLNQLFNWGSKLKI